MKWNIPSADRPQFRLPWMHLSALHGVLDELYAAGVSREDITVVFALGSHRCHTEEEKIHLAGERCYREVRCIDSDPNDCIHIGTTKSAQEAFDIALEKYGPDATVIAMPYGGATLPIV